MIQINIWAATDTCFTPEEVEAIVANLRELVRTLGASIEYAFHDARHKGPWGAIAAPGESVGAVFGPPEA